MYMYTKIIKKLMVLSDSLNILHHIHIQSHAHAYIHTLIVEK